MGSLIEAVASPITGLLGGIGAQKGANEQAAYADKSLNLYQEMMNQARADLAPYRTFGQQGMPMLMQANQDANYDRSAALGDYFAGPEYAMLQQQAAQNQMAGGEAMGGMGATSTGNSLASIAPQLGMSHLATKDALAQDAFNRALNITNIGSGAAGSTAAISSGGASGAANLMLNKGSAEAQKKAMPWMIAADQNQRAGQGAASFANFFTSMFGGGGF